MHAANFGSPNCSSLVMTYGEMSLGEGGVPMFKGEGVCRLLQD